MPHFDFLEMIAEGFVVEAYNSKKKREQDRIDLYAYDLDRIEQALRELRGEAAPSSAARGAPQAGQSNSASSASAKGGKATKRKLATEADGTLPEATLKSAEPHGYIDKADAVCQNFISAKAKNYCMYKYCPHAAANKKKKCGVGMKYEQEGPSRAPGFCIHPNCKCGYHVTCYSRAHGLLPPSGW